MSNEMNRYAYNISNEDGVGEIDIYGVVGSYWDELDATSFRRALKGLGDVSRINVHIHSPGGYVEDGLLIFTLLSAHTADVHTYNEGTAASMASILMLCGNTRHMAANAWYMIHNVSGGAWGEIKDLEKTVKRMKQLQDQLIGIYVQNADPARDEIVEMMDEETWFNAKDAKEHGFIDEIEGEVEMRAVAFGEYRNFPEELLAIADETRLTPANEPPGPPGKQKEDTMSIPKNTGDEPVTLVELMKLHPEAFKEDVDVEAVASDAVKAERARFTDVMSLADKPGIDRGAVQKLALEGLTKDEAKSQLFDDLDIEGISALNKRRTESNVVVRIDGTTGKPIEEDISNLPLEQQLEKQWDSDPELREEFLNEKESFIAYEMANSQGRIKLLHSAKGGE